MRGKVLSCDDHMQIFAQRILPLLQKNTISFETFDGFSKYLYDIFYHYYRTNIFTTRSSIRGKKTRKILLMEDI